MKAIELESRLIDFACRVMEMAADLAGSKDIRIEDLAEAIYYRSLDREGWAG